MRRKRPHRRDHSPIDCKVTGKKEDNGYNYVKEVGVSIQGPDANNAWKATYNVLQALKMPVEVIFVWQDNPKAATPGAIG